MWQRTKVLASVLAFLSAAPAAATDDDAFSDGRAPRVRLMGNMGIASAVGEMGGTFTYAPVPELELELGAGIGASGFQFSFLPKLSGGGRRHRLSLGIGPSVGLGSNTNPSETCVSLWLNAEAGYEFRSPSGFSFLLALGLGKGLAGKMPGLGTPGVTEAGEPVGPELVADLPIFPQGRIAFGRWF
jgi:hypothetical protein